MNTEKYIGTWILLPELSIYQSGKPPLDGKYSISFKNGEIHFQVEWQDENNENHALNFGGPLDGKKHSIESPGVTAVLYEKISDLILDSAAFNGEKPILYARRQASNDGRILAVSQAIYTGKNPLTNLQVYRRESS